MKRDKKRRMRADGGEERDWVGDQYYIGERGSSRPDYKKGKKNCPLANPGPITRGKEKRGEERDKGNQIKKKKFLA